METFSLQAAAVQIIIRDLEELRTPQQKQQGSPKSLYAPSLPKLPRNWRELHMPSMAINRTQKRCIQLRGVLSALNSPQSVDPAVIAQVGGLASLMEVKRTGEMEFALLEKYLFELHE